MEKNEKKIWVFALGFIPNFLGFWVSVLGVFMKPVPKTQSQIFLGVNVWVQVQKKGQTPPPPQHRVQKKFFTHPVKIQLKFQIIYLNSILK